MTDIVGSLASSALLNWDTEDGLSLALAREADHDNHVFASTLSGSSDSRLADNTTTLLEPTLVNLAKDLPWGSDLFDELPTTSNSSSCTTSTNAQADWASPFVDGLCFPSFKMPSNQAPSKLPATIDHESHTLQPSPLAATATSTSLGHGASPASTISLDPEEESAAQPPAKRTCRTRAADIYAPGSNITPHLTKRDLPPSIPHDGDWPALSVEQLLAQTTSNMDHIPSDVLLSLQEELQSLDNTASASLLPTPDAWPALPASSTTRTPTSSSTRPTHTSHDIRTTIQPCVMTAEDILEPVVPECPPPKPYVSGPITEEHVATYSLHLSYTVGFQDGDDFEEESTGRGSKNSAANSLKGRREQAVIDYFKMPRGADGSAASEANRRMVMNILERARREDLKRCFARLASVLPQLRDKPDPAKKDVLQQAREQIVQLQAVEQEYLRHLNELRQQHRTLTQAIAH